MTNEFDKPSNVVNFRRTIRIPENLTPEEALGHIRTLIDPLSYALGETAVNLTLDGIRELIRKSIG